MHLLVATENFASTDAITISFHTLTQNRFEFARKIMSRKKNQIVYFVD